MANQTGGGSRDQQKAGEKSTDRQQQGQHKDQSGQSKGGQSKGGQSDKGK